MQNHEPCENFENKETIKMNVPVQASPIQRQFNSVGIVLPGVELQNLCVGVTVENGQACVTLPVLGKKCFGSLPSWLNGQNASVCYVPPFSACLYFNNQQIACI
jgi:hypothetical protein